MMRIIKVLFCFNLGLCENPFLFSMAIEISKEMTISPKKPNFFKISVETILSKYLSRKYIKTGMSIELSQIMKLLIFLAVFIHEKRKVEIIMDQNTEDFLKLSSVYNVWESIKDDVKNGLFPLLINNNQKLKFTHLMFQEYFTSVAWANKSLLTILRKTKRYLFINLEIQIQKVETSKTQKNKCLLVQSIRISKLKKITLHWSFQKMTHPMTVCSLLIKTSK
jgi:hypothetical protein